MINGPRIGFRLDWDDLWNVDTGGEHTTISGNPLDQSRRLNGTPRVDVLGSVGLASLGGTLELYSWNGTTVRIDGPTYVAVSLPVDVWFEWDWRTGQRRILLGSHEIAANLNRTWQGVAYSLSAQVQAASGALVLPGFTDNGWGQQVNWTVELLGVDGGWETDWEDTDETTDWSSQNSPQWVGRTSTTWTGLYGAADSTSSPTVRRVMSKYVAVRSPFPCAPLPSPDGMLVAAYDRHGSGAASSNITRERVVGLVGEASVVERARVTTLTAGNEAVWFERNGRLYLPTVQSRDWGRTWSSATGVGTVTGGSVHRESMGQGVQAAMPVLQGVSNQTQTSTQRVMYRRAWHDTSADATYAVCQYGDLFASWPAAGVSNLPLYHAFLPSGILEWGVFCDGRQQIFRSRDGGTTWDQDVDESTTNAAGLVAVDYWRSPSGVEALVGYDVDEEGIYTTLRTAGGIWSDWTLATDAIAVPCWPTIFQDRSGRWRIVAFAERAWRLFQADWPTATWSEVTP